MIDTDEEGTPYDGFPKPTCQACGETDYQRGRMVAGEWVYYCPHCGAYDTASQAIVDAMTAVLAPTFL